jgi:hypothetical protein
MMITTDRRIRAKITIRGHGGADVSVILIEGDGKETRLAVPPLAHPDAIEGFIYALAAQHGVGVDAVEIAVEDQRSPFFGRQPVPGQVH